MVSSSCTKKAQETRPVKHKQASDWSISAIQGFAPATFPKNLPSWQGGRVGYDAILKNFYSSGFN